MLMYSKLYDLLTGTSKGNHALKCSIKELYGRNEKLRYIYFETRSATPCLLYISSKYDVAMENKKFLPLSRWQEDEINFDAVLAADPENSIVKEIRATTSPLGYVNLINRLEPSLKSIPYKIAILSEEYLIVLDESSEVDIFYIKGPKEAKLLVVLDLETLLFKNIIPELERVHRNVIKIIQESTDTYWDSLLTLLKKCQQIKIVTNGKQDTTSLIEQAIKIGVSQKAIKLALECFNEPQEIS
jgi:hypothetical protein